MNYGGCHAGIAAGYFPEKKKKTGNHEENLALSLQKPKKKKETNKPAHRKRATSALSSHRAPSIASSSYRTFNTITFYKYMWN